MSTLRKYAHVEQGSAIPVANQPMLTQAASTILILCSALSVRQIIMQLNSKARYLGRAHGGSKMKYVITIETESGQKFHRPKKDYSPEEGVRLLKQEEICLPAGERLWQAKVERLEVMENTAERFTKTKNEREYAALSSCKDGRTPIAAMAANDILDGIDTDGGWESRQKVYLSCWLGVRI